MCLAVAGVLAEGMTRQDYVVLLDAEGAGGEAETRLLPSSVGLDEEGFQVPGRGARRKVGRRTLHSRLEGCG